MNRPLIAFLCCGATLLVVVLASRDGGVRVLRSKPEQAFTVGRPTGPNRMGDAFPAQVDLSDPRDGLVVFERGSSLGVSEADLRRMVVALRGGDENARRDTFFQLAELGDWGIRSPSSFEPSQDPSGVRWLLRVRLLAREVMPALEVCLGANDEDLRRDALRVLSELGPHGIEGRRLVEFELESENSAIRRDVGDWVGEWALSPERALSILLEDPERDLHPRDLQMVAAIGSRAKAVVPLLIRLVERGPRHLRGDAIEAIRAIGPAAWEAEGTLVALLGSTFRIEASDALNAVGSSRRASLVDHLEMLADPAGQDERRAAAARALGRLGGNGTDAVTMLTKTLESSRSPVLLTAAAEALADLGVVSHVGTLAICEVLNKNTLGHRKERALLRAAVRVSKDADGVARTLLEHLPPAIDPFNGRSWMRAEIYEASRVARIGWLVVDSQAARDAIVRAARSGRYIKAWRALVALPEFGEDRDVAVDLLIEALERGNLFSRMLAARGLGEMGAAAKIAVPVLKTVANDKATEFVLRSEVHEALRRLR